MTGGRDDRLVSCDPCSPENLHLMAQEMGIRRCWYHGDHYALPKTFDLMRFALNVQVVTHVELGAVHRDTSLEPLCGEGPAPPPPSST